MKHETEECGLDVSLVLCNERTKVRMITTYSMVSKGRGFSLPQIHHPNFTDIYELYYVKDQVFVISEYLDFSLEDLLKHSIWPTETEIAFIISQVRRTDILLTPVSELIAIGAGWYTVYLVKKTQSPTHFSTEYSDSCSYLTIAT